MGFLDLDRKNLPADLVAGAVTSLIAIPDAIASAFLAGVNPTYGFNAYMIGTPVGSILSSSHFMSIGLTSAMMLAVADALAGLEDASAIPALFTLTLLIGIFQLALGLLKLGRFTQFISNSVMIGFLTGVAILVILGQLGDLTGYSSAMGRSVTRAIDVLLHPGRWNMPSLMTGLATIALIVVFSRTRLEKYSVALALVIVSVAVVLLQLDSVALIGDSTPVSGSFPRPALPELSVIPQLLFPAVAIGLIGLVQAAGVSQTIPNPDGEYPDASRDFSAQGIANVAAGIFRGLPVGGSMGGTGIVMSAGAKSRWANIFVGVFLTLFVLLFAQIVDLVAMPAIAGVLIVVGVQIINTEEVGDVWDVSVSKRVIMVVTLAATLILPIAQAILLGVFLSFIDYVYSSAQHIALSAIELREDGALVERPAPSALSDDSVTVLHARGSYYFAAARTIEDSLPDAKSAQRAVVILRLRGVDSVGSTFINVLERYARQLRSQNGKLMLCGVHDSVLQQLLRTETTDDIPMDDIFMATDVLGASTSAALAAARKWIDSTPRLESIEPA